MSFATIALVVFLICAGLIYLGVTFTYLGLITGIAALLAALFTLVSK